MNRKPKRQKKELKIAEKIELCSIEQKNPKIANKTLATQFEIGESTVHDILKRKNEYLNKNPNHHLASRKRDRPPRFRQLEEALAIWCDAVVEANLPLSGHLLQSKALQFAVLLGISVDEFKCSNGWITNFKNRYNICEYTRCGEANSAPLEKLPTYRTELQQVISQFELKDVFNADETALYWKLLPSKTLSSHSVSGVKKMKDRITILLTCNTTGTEKLLPLLIYKYKNPRCMKNINKDTLPVHYYWNSSAWMQSSIFKHWLNKLNSDMHNKQRKILLLVDNATSHQFGEDSSFSNITVHYFPANTTAHLQPCDAGVIYSFKVHKFVLLKKGNLFLYF